MILSIIIPAYNVEDYISNNLYSLLNQTNKDTEIIIVNDGSTDDTENISKNIFLNSNFVNYRIINQTNSGVSSARNAGLNVARGNYVVFLDSDDYVSDKFVESIFDEMDDSIEVICWGFNSVTENKELIRDYFDKYKSIQNPLTGIEAFNKIMSNSMKVCTGSMAISIELLRQNNILYTVGCINGEDQEFNYKCLLKAKTVKFINNSLTYYVKRQGSVTNSFNINKLDSVLAFSRIYEFIDNMNSNEGLDEIKNKQNELIINEYLGNINSFIRFIMRENNNRKKVLNVLFKNIEEEYPGLNSKMHNMLRKYRGSNLKIHLMSKLLIYSKIIYSYVVTCENTYRERRKVI